MEIEVQDTHLEFKVSQEQRTKRNLVEGQDGVKDVDAIPHVFKNMICIYADNVSEKLQIL